MREKEKSQGAHQKGDCRMGKSLKKQNGVAVIEKPKAPEGVCRCCSVKIAVGEVSRSESGYCLSCSQKIARARKIGVEVKKMVYA